MRELEINDSLMEIVGNLTNVNVTLALTVTESPMVKTGFGKYVKEQSEGRGISDTNI